MAQRPMHVPPAPLRVIEPSRPGTLALSQVLAQEGVTPLRENIAKTAGENNQVSGVPQGA